MGNAAQMKLTMDSLPNELLIQIASHLDHEPPSITKFAHEPSAHLTYSDVTPLKALSQVSWRWRKITLPILFRFSRVSLDNSPQWVPIDARLIEDMQSQLTTLSNHEFQIYHKMRSKFKSSSTFAFDEAFDDLLINLCRIQEGDEFLKSVPHILWLPHLPRNFAEFVRFLGQYDLQHHLKSLVVYTDQEYELRHVTSADAPLSRAVSEIWNSIFSHLDPPRIVVAAPPTTIAGLLDTQMLSSDAWAFDMKMHYVELRRPEYRIEHQGSICRPWDAALIHRRPWNHLGYNEGSSITAYSTYEYHLKQSPKMLYLLLLRLAKEVQDCCNIRSFSLVSVFPFSTNMTTIIRALQKIRTLRTVHFQLAPGPENNLLSTPKKMGRAQAGDLWLEWNESYKIIGSFLGLFEFENGSEFISSDCVSSIQMASEVEDYLQKLQDRGVGWRHSRVGTWVRDHRLDIETEDAAVE
jgi:hypothetical protein